MIPDWDSCILLGYSAQARMKVLTNWRWTMLGFRQHWHVRRCCTWSCGEEGEGTRGEQEDSYGQRSIPAPSIFQQQDAGSQLLSRTAATPSTRHRCWAKQKWGRVWHLGSGSKGEPGCAGREQRGQSRLRLSCSVPEIWQVCILGWRDLAVQSISGEERVNSQLGCLEERLCLWKRLLPVKQVTSNNLDMLLC